MVKLDSFPSHKSFRLANVACAYCGVAFDTGVEPTEDHVIGRRFVPRGALSRSWNLKLRSCSRCNNVKSQLEDDVSAITMQPDVYGRFATDDPRLREDAARKARGSVSRRSGKLVANSSEHLRISASAAPNFEMNLDLSGVAQLDDDRAWLLARYQLAGFFYLITYSKPERKGHWWPGCFAPVAVVPRLDWGNSLVLGFQRLVDAWEHRLHGIGASDYFGIAIRRSPSQEALWSWALEWNRNWRLIGFFGNESEARRLMSGLPRPATWMVKESPTRLAWLRHDCPLRDEEDWLFDAPETNPPPAPAMGMPPS